MLVDHRGDPVSLIRTNLQSLDGVFLRIATWFLTNQVQPADIRGLSTGALAKALGTSRATIVRFCQHLGYAGFPEFKAALTNAAIVQTGGGSSLMHLPPAVERIYSITRDSLDATLETLDIAQFEKAVQAVANAATIVLYGVGDSTYLACSAAHKLAMAAKPSFAVSSTPSLRVHLPTIVRGDVVVLISQSGRWQNVLHTLEPFRAKGCLVITITSQANSLMARYADILLLTAARDITMGDHPLTLRAAQAMVVDMLVVSVGIRMAKVSTSWEEPRIALQRRPDVAMLPR